jgi:hypothetical protein
MVTPARSSHTRLGLQYPYAIERGFAMTVEVAVLLILGIVIVFTCRDGRLKAAHASDRSCRTTASNASQRSSPEE